MFRTFWDILLTAKAPAVTEAEVIKSEKKRNPRRKKLTIWSDSRSRQCGGFISHVLTGLRMATSDQAHYLFTACSLVCLDLSLKCCWTERATRYCSPYKWIKPQFSAKPLINSCIFPTSTTALVFIMTLFRCYILHIKHQTPALIFCFNQFLITILSPRWEKWWS